MIAIREAIKVMGSQKKLAEAIGNGITQQKISYWLTVGKVPAEYVLNIERVSGVSRHKLRPDIYPIVISDQQNSAVIR
ncbi:MULTISPECIES: transcriptional regulator [unclassified Pseudoalteromonas]|uniref:transcriptional regulator n=1 Tax=unclassified Pseudoalteromonas TaxID=194690 RepID=UPI001F3A7BB8|nr:MULTISPECIES: YdaS family helix-turn-helix protein [unclassified Pseudoalteromonas]MCF2827105.1 helix-turn-helix domain-containing protein [Pseudoalteromonas sp. OF5H-5]MCF2834248.1 helix-turn-helix domain-containing protein [Pseudoalteromonas sp. DL2-H6]MCF2925882.1 helix-turn-helix domain-containing protein [Pseudoalteromonas sp. DL2-H1]